MMEDSRRYDKANTVDFSELKGKTITEVEGFEKGSERITFRCSDNSKFTLTYYDDCCASCNIEDICGDVSDLLGSPILLAEEVTSTEPDESLKSQRKADYEKRKAEDGEHFYESDYSPNPRNGWKEESETWNFYKLSTIKGSVTIRWYGSSNGYYSETATFEKWKL